jgi:hypothetical protein
MRSEQSLLFPAYTLRQLLSLTATYLYILAIFLLLYLSSVICLCWPLLPLQMVGLFGGHGVLLVGNVLLFEGGDDLTIIMFVDVQVVVDEP